MTNWKRFRPVTYMAIAAAVLVCAGCESGQMILALLRDQLLGAGLAIVEDLITQAASGGV